MAGNTVWTMTGIKGESKLEGYDGFMDLENWSWGVSQSATPQAGGGGGSAKCTAHDVTITRSCDTASVPLMVACAKGSHFDEAEINVCKAGGDNLCYFKLKLMNVIIANHTQSGGGGDGVPTESISLAFEEFALEYQEQGPDGAASGGAVTGGFNALVNKES